MVLLHTLSCPKVMEIGIFGVNNNSIRGLPVQLHTYSFVSHILEFLKEMERKCFTIAKHGQKFYKVKIAEK